MILKNGKRIDGCTDTVPVGTVQPFLGLTPPLGYLICQGQLISKVEYPELYNICKSTFGTETETHFYLPDLRGKTLAGYDESNSAMNTIGKLIGQAEHTHIVPNHSHTYSLRYSSYWDALVQFADDQGADTLLAARQKDGSYKKASEYKREQLATQMNSGIAGSRTEMTTTSHFQVDGDTSEASTTASTTSNYQPTITVNWIVKAAMLIPHYFTVENTLTSTNTSNALSAAQGKVLNGKFANYLPLNGGTMTGEIAIGQGDYKGIQLGENGRINATLGGNTNCTVLGMLDACVIVGHTSAPLLFRGSYSTPLYNGVAFIETGSNSNGTWIKFVDGTMICRHTKGVSVECTSQWGNLYEGGADLGSLPATFSDTPTVMVTNTAPDGYLEGLRSSSATSWGHIRMAIPSSATRDFVVNLLAIGRWK